MITAAPNGLSIKVNGQQQPVVLGQEIQQGSTLFVAENASFELRLQDGTTHNQQDFTQTEPSADDAFAEIEALQQLIESGDDPTEELPETAAGGQISNQGGIDFTSVSRTGVETLASTTFDTNTVNIAPQNQAIQPAQISDVIEFDTQTVDDSNSISEDSVATGNVLANDIYLDSLITIVTYEINGQTIAAGDSVTLEGGELIINADGSYIFTPNDHWNGTTPTVTYTTNTGSTASLNIEVTPVDDASILENDTNTVAEDNIASGNVLSNDSDVESDLSVTSYEVNGNTIAAGDSVTLEGGVLIINVDGSYTFTPNDHWNGTTPTVTYTTNTGSTATLNIEVTPVDDAPVISADSGSVTEGEQAPVTGTLTGSDADNPTLSFSAQTINNDYGQFTVNSDGSWSFTLADNATVNGLTEGEEHIEVFTVTLSDDSTTTVTITITGTDDAPVISADSGSVTEGEQAPVTGTLTGSDADNPTLSFSAQTINNDYGQFTVNSDGSWSFTLADNATVNGLTEGEEHIEVFTVTLSDDSTTTVTITITGTDDAPVISADSGSVTEGEQAPVTGTLTGSDADNPTLSFSAQTINNDYGQFTVNSDGSWSFTLADNATVNGLTEGEEHIEVFTVTLSDDSTTTVTITITGTDDAPVISADSGSVTEGEQAPVTGTLTGSDADNPTLSFSAQTINNDYGQFTVNSDGSWSFTLADNATVNGLTEGEEHIEVFTVTLSDDSTTTVTITITGTDDAPVISADSGSVTEGEQAPVTGTLTGSDADNPTLSFSAQTINNDYGQFTVNSDGSWSFTLADNATVNGLTEGEEHIEVFTVTLSDDSTTTVTITITGTDDAPVISADGGSVTEGEQAPVTGTLTGSDADNPTLSFSAQTINNDYGQFTVNSDGSWSFTLADNATVNGLTEGEEHIEVFTVTLSDDSTTTVTITITGTDDAPVISADSGSVTEGEQAPVTGTLTGSDADNPTLSFSAQTINNDYGQFTVNSDGSWSFTLADNATVNGLTEGEEHIEVFTVTLSDDSTTTVTITITGTDDAPVISADSGSVTEGEQAPVTGTLTGSDADNPTLSFSAQTINNDYGQFTVNSDGSWSFTLADNATVNGLTEGEEHIEVFTVTLSDDSTTTVTITITGTDDAPVISADSGSVTEGEQAPVTGTLTGSDADNPTLSFSAQTINNDYGQFTVNSDGSWSFTLADNATVNGLTEGEEHIEVFTVTLSDDSTTTVTITITGTDDAPVISADSGSVTEGEQAPVTGTLTGSDADNPTLSFSAQTINNDYGQFTVNSDGSWSFTLADNATVNGLTEGEEHIEVFTVTLSDDSTTTVTITITGTDDAPVISADSGSVTEGEQAPVTGTLTGSDADNPTLSFSAQTINNDYGQFTVNSDGSWSFTLADNATVNGLTEGEEHIEVFTVTLSDDSTTTVTITITGTDDAPVISADSGSVTEGEQAPVTGTLTGSDADNPTLSFSAQTINNDYGQFTVNSDGSWSFTLADNATVNGLTEGEEHIEVFTVTLSDDSTTTVTITITGTDDAPVISADSGSVTEGEQAPVTGTLTGSDADNPTLSFSAQTINNDYGQFTVNSDGSWSFTLADNATVNGLTEGEEHIEVFTVTLSDDSTTTVTITITGTDDAPVISADSGSVTEGEQAPVTGTLTGSDADNPTLSFSAQTINNDYGQFTVNSDGSWSFTLADNATVNGLTEGEEHIEVFTVTLSDDSTTTVTITITGTDDAPVISADSGSVTEGEQAPVTGTLTGSDADNPTLSFSAQTINNDYGQFTVNSDGSWSFTLADNATVNGLTEGEEHIEVFTVTLSDDSTTTVTITITGTDDAPVISADSGSVTEGEQAPVTGTLTGSDADNPTLSFSAQTINNDYGQFTVNSDGSWSFTLADNATVNGLTEGEEHIEVFTVTLSDDSTTTVTITITGTDDAPVISADSGSVTEGEQAPVTGTLTGSDADNPTLSFSAQTINNDYGQFTVNSDGSWSFTLADNATVNGLTEGEEHIEVFTVTLSDDSTTTVTITITGTDDAPVISADSGSVTEGEQAPVTGTLTGSDADNPTLSFSAQTINNDYGQFTVNSDGSWSFTLADNATVNGLTEGEEHIEVFTVTLSDDSTTTVTITITGTDDAPVISADSGSVTEGEQAPVTGTLTGSDADNPTLSFSAQTINNDYGQFTVNSDGSWSFTLADNATVNGLTEGEEHIEVFTVTLSDDSTTTVTITITGTDDAPVISADSGSVTEGEQAPVTGTLTGSDADNPTLSFSAQTINNDYGQFTVNSDGSWSFTLADNATVNGLTEGEEHIEVFTVTLSDDSTTTVTITITGTDDAPVISADSGSVTEGEQAPVTGTLTGSDADNPTLSFSAQTINNDYGQFTVNSDGSWSFTLADNATVNGLTEGEEHIEVFTVTLSDDSTTTVTITITGTDDAPVISADSGSVTEGEQAPVTGTLTGSDADNPTLSFSAQTINNDYGQFTVNSDGSWSFTLADNATVNGLTEGEEHIEVFTVTLSDDSTTTVTITITGTDDAPVISADSGSVTEGEQAPVTGTLTGSDADNPTLSFSAQTINNDYGQFTVNSDGSWSFTLADNATVNGLTEGEEHIEVFTVTLSDDSTTTVTITITGTDDAPVISADSGSVTEGEQAPVTGTLTGSDADNPTLSFSAQTINNDYGQFTVNSDGSWSFTLADNATVNGLTEGEEHIEVFTVTLSDDSTTTVTITITGTDDAPVISADSGSVTEGEQAPVTGTLTGSDADNPTLSFSAQTINNDYGQFTVNSDGSWSFTLADNATVNGLTEGEEHIEVFTVTLSDDSTTTVTITITGTDDAPVISADSGSVTEGEQAPVTGTLTGSDADNPTLSFSAQTINNDYGQFTVNSDGSWSFTLADNATVNGLTEGEEHIEVFTVTLSDDSTTTVTITITGTDDAPVISADSGSVTEGEQAPVTGTLTGSDADNPTLSFSAQTINNDYGQFTVNSDGSWSFTLADNATVNGLTEGEEHIEVFTVTLSDDSTTTVTITITGTDDAPVISADSGSVTEGEQAPVTGTLTGSDADNPTLSFSAQTINNDYGQFTVNSDGSWSFTLADNATVNGLTEGEEHIEVFTVTLSDDSTTTVTITITGTDDAPVISADSGSVTEGEQAPVTGTLTGSDADNPTLSFSAQTINNDYGQFTVNSDGSWSFTLADNATVNGLTEGEEHIEVFTVTLSDDSTTTVTITITGTDDAPVISADSGSVTEGEQAPVTGTLTGSDADNPTLSFSAQTINNDYGQFTVNSDGSWSFTLADNATVNGLTEGEEHIEVFTVTLSDDSTTTVTITITGTDDAPVISADSGSVTEGEQAPVTGTLTGSDADNPTLSFSAQTINNDYGQFTVNSDGSWSFTLADNATVNGLTEGEEHIEVFTVTLSDDSTTTVTITITGTDDAPVISADSGSVTEGEQAPVTGTLTGSDADNPTLSFSAQTINNDYGQFTVNSDGSWSFTLADNATVNGLTEGEEHIEVFTVTLSDDSTTVTITITGTDDAPVISADSGSVTEGEQAPVTGTLTGSDADNPTLSFSAQTINNDYGQFTVNSDGSWSFTLADNATVNGLTEGEEHIEVFTVTLSDDSTTTVTITITGTDDAPVISADSGSVTEGEQAPVTGTLTGSDADNPTLSFSAQTINNDYGQFTVNSDGSWSFTLADNATVNGLTEGEEHIEVFTVTLSDDSTTTVTITITGTDDAPVISADSGSVTEGEQAPVTGTLTGSDADNPTLSFSAQTINNDYGQFTVNSDGSWSFTLADNATVNGLTEGEEHIEVFTVTLSDDSTTTVTITITGTDDAPVISADSGSVTEGEQAPVTGTLTGSDADNPTLSFSAQTINNDYGQFTVNSDGSWSFTLADNATVNGLTEGEEHIEVFTVTLSDDSTTTVTITITGTDDAPVISADSGSVTEGEQAPVTGTLTGSDADNPTLSFSAQTINNDYGQFTVNSDGSWSFTLADNATVNGLTEGEEHIEVFTVTLSDDSTTTVTITITGTDDAPVISADSGSVTEGEQAPVTGTLTGSDADNPTLSFSAQTINNDYGQFTVNSDGSWSFTLADNATVNGLTEGEEHIEVFTVTLSDDSTTTVTITITGTDDAPVISADSGSVTEGEQAPVTGTLTGSDADNPTLSFSAQTINNDYGQFTVNSDGSWSFTLADNATVNGLTEGEEHIEVFTVTLSDDSTTTVTITITGTDDAPVISADSGSVTEGEQAPVTGTLTGSDADNPTLSFSAQTINNDYGQFTVNSDGSWSFTLADNATVNGLTEGEEHIEVFTVTLSDDSTTTVTITITGTDDAPVISADSGSVTEGEQAPVTGTLTGSDADNPTLSFSAQTINNDYGQFTVNSDGSWSFTLADNATVNGLTEGEEHIEVFTVTLSDDSTTTVTITINGTNDAPHAEADTVEMKESDIAYNTAYVVDSRGNLALVNLSTGAHTKIADTGTIFTDVAISQSGELFGINFNSLYTIDKLSGEVTPINEELDVRANALTFSDDGRLYAAAGDAIYELDPTDGSVLHAYDNLGVFSAGDLAFHNGKMYWTTYDGALYEVVINETTGKATVNEVISDLGLTTGNYGLVSGHDGNLYVFSGNTILLVDPINGTSEVVVIYDGIGSVFGTTIPAAVNNEATGNVLDNDTDIDNNHNSLTVTRVEFNGVTYNVGDEISGTYGFLQLQSNGEFTYRLDESREVTQDLAEGELAYDVFTYTVSDGSGGSDTATLTIKITGTDADADTGSPASEPTLSLEAGSLLASLNFEGVVTNRSISNDQNVQVSVLNDMFTGNWGSNNQYGTVEIGKASTYLNEDASKDHGDVLELENREGDNTLFLDVVLDASKFYSLNFEAAARQDTTASNSNFTVKLQKVNDDGELTGEVITLRDINFSSVNKWLEIQEFFKVEASGKYRITFEGDDADSHGALLDNIEFSESINEGIENTDIKLSNINAALNDNDGSETMIVTLSGLPEGAILKGLNNGEKVEVKVGPNGTVDVSEWDLNSLSIRVDHVGNFDVVVTVTSVESGQFQNSVSKTIELAVLYDTELYPPLSANTYSIISNMSDGSTIDIPEEWLMYSDTVTDSAHVTEAVNGVVSVDLIDNGSFAYSIHDGRTESDTDVAIVLSNELTGNENNDVIIANPDGGNVTIKGKQGNDVVVGGNGDDNINGNIGDDLIIGGRGDDFLKGGGQKTFDTFVWQAGDADGGKDQIEDFEFDFDTLDLSDLLQGEDLNTIENFLSISFVDGSTFINIDVDGQGDYTDQQIELINRDLFNKKTLTEAQVLQNLLGENGDGPLIIDTENSFNSANSAIQTSGSSEDELRITLSVDGNHIP